MHLESIRYEREGTTAIVTLARPQRRNALSLNTMRELIQVLDAISQSAATRAVILAAEGNVFSSGHDLTEMTDRRLGDYRQLFQVCSDLMLKIQRIPQPVIAEVQGIATAAGCQLVAACDLAFCAETAQFSTPGVRIGLFCSTPMVPLVRAIGRKRAMELLLTGDSIDGMTAEAWGLVNRAVPADQLRDLTLDFADKIARASNLTTSIGKQAFYASIDLDESSAYNYTKEIMAMNATTADAQEGILAFLEKRKPTWSGR